MSTVLVSISCSLYVRGRRSAEVKHTVSEVCISSLRDKNRIESGIARSGLGKKDGVEGVDGWENIMMNE